MCKKKAESGLAVETSLPPGVRAVPFTPSEPTFPFLSDLPTSQQYLSADELLMCHFSSRCSELMLWSSLSKCLTDVWEKKKSIKNAIQNLSFCLPL